MLTGHDLCLWTLLRSKMTRFLMVLEKKEKCLFTCKVDLASVHLGAVAESGEVNSRELDVTLRCDLR